MHLGVQVAREHAIVVVLVLTLLGCGDPESEPTCSDPRSAPRLVLQDSVTLQESESLYVGNPAATFTFDDQGRAYIPDPGNSRLLSFTPQGHAAQVFGGPGEGPGEFRGVGFVGLVTPQVVLQNDYRLRRINLYDRQANALGSIAYRGRLTWMNAVDETIWLGVADHGSGFAVAPVHISTLLAPQADSVKQIISATMIRLPSEYKRYRVLASWDDVKSVRWADTSAVAFGGLEYIVRYQREGLPIDTTYVPVCRRHGSEEALLNRWFRIPARTSSEQQEFTRNAETNISGLLGLWRLSDGKFLIWYVDSHRAPGRVLRGVAYLSVLSPDLKSACVDAELTAPGSGRARLTVFKDDVVLLDQVIEQTTGEPRVRSVLRRYSIDTESCRWATTKRISGK